MTGNAFIPRSCHSPSYRGLLRRSLYVGLLAAGLAAQSAYAVPLQVTVENLSDEGGIYLTPIWAAFHDGSFDTFTLGEAATAGVERIAEDGTGMTLAEEFAAGQPNGLDGLITDPDGFAGAPVFDPGSKASMVFDVSPDNQRFFSFASMVIPSNDAFIGNDNPTAYQVFDEDGNFTGPLSILVFGNEVWDAGTEANTETEAAFLNQTGPDMGDSTSDNISVHPGFNGSVGNPDATPVNVLGGTTAAGTVVDAVAGDFSRSNFMVARITISEATVPLRLTVRNESPADGLFLTPVWVAFHNADFDTFSGGEASSPELERLAEDGGTGPISELFAATSTGQDTTVTDPEGFAGAPVFDPQSSESLIVNLDPANNRYFSFASMVIPSNDAFIGNGNPRAYRIFNEDGSFAGPLNISVEGSQVYDAGTEANTETEAAFLNQTGPDMGDSTADGISLHIGFNGSEGNPDGTPQNILGGTTAAGTVVDPAAGDFTTAGYRVASFSLSRAVDGSFSGNWYNPERSGEGYVVEITHDDNGEARIVVSFYTYLPDGSGGQAWVIGEGPVLGQSAVADVFITDGTVFGSGFNADDVTRTYWGQIRFDFIDCQTVQVSLEPVLDGYSASSTALSRLTGGPIGFTGACQP